MPLIEDIEGKEIGFGDEEDYKPKDFPADPYDDYDSYYDETEGSESTEGDYGSETEEEPEEEAPLMQFKGLGSYHEWRVKKEEQEQRDREER